MITMSQQARKYDKTFKTNAVKLFHESKKKATEIAQNLGIPESTLQTWIEEYKTNGNEGFRGSDHTPSFLSPSSTNLSMNLGWKLRCFITTFLN